MMNNDNVSLLFMVYHIYYNYNLYGSFFVGLILEVVVVGSGSWSGSRGRRMGLIGGLWGGVWG